MTVSYDYEGKVAFVTGAGAGIGRSTALAFAAAGVAVAVVDRSEENARDTAAQIEAEGGRAVAIRCDVGREADVAAARRSTRSAGSTSPSTQA